MFLVGAKRSKAALQFIITPLHSVTESLTNSVLVLLCRSTPPPFPCRRDLLCPQSSRVAMALLRTASRVRGGEREIKNESTSYTPSLWDVTIHLLRYRHGDSIRPPMSGRAAAADQTFRKQRWMTSFLHPLTVSPEACVCSVSRPQVRQ